MSDTEGTGLVRWSSARDCPRKAVYEATGAPHRERTQREDRILARGRSIGHEYLIALAHEQKVRVHVASGVDFMLPYPDLRAENPLDAGIVAEPPIVWEHGVGHADGWVRKTNTVLEILSTQHASGDAIDSKLVQARGYAHWLGATSIALVLVDPSTLEDERIILTNTSPRWDELGQDVLDRIDQIGDALASGEPPPRVCHQPSSAIGHFCLFAGHCFEGWEPPAAGDTIDDEEAQLAAGRLLAVKNLRRDLAVQDRLYEAEAKALQAQLADIVPAGAFNVGGYEVKRSDRTSRRFDLTRAERDSRIPDELLDEFVSTSAFSVWTVERAGDPVVYESTEEEVPY